MKKEKIKLELRQKQLKELFEMIMLYEVLRGEMYEEEEASPIYELLKEHFSRKEREVMAQKAFSLLDEYLEWENIHQIDSLLDEEKEALLKAIEDVQTRNGLKGEVPLENETLRLKKIGVLRLPIGNKKQDD